MKMSNAGFIYITYLLGTELRKTLKKINTPLRNQIREGIDLRTSKKKMKTSLKQDIEKGVQLKLTKNKLKTPLREEIQNGKRLRKTNPKTPSNKDREVLQPSSNRVKGQHNVADFGDFIENLKINERQILKAKRRCETAGIPSVGFNMVTFSGSDSKVFFVFLTTLIFR